MIRAALFAVVVFALPALAQTPGTKKPSTSPTKAAPVSKSPPATKKPAADTGPLPGKTTLSGIYTLEEATAGKELFLGVCTSCHPIATHSTGEFRKKWQGRTLAELYTYMRTMMPKNDPGSLADEDYGIALAYLLQANRMPAGKTYLSTDTLELRKIRFDSVRAVRKP